MRKQFSVILLISLLTTAAFGQERVIWASEVIDISSEYSPLEYSAIQVLHKPNVLPAGGDNPNAWRPKRDDNEQFIVVGFDEPIRAQQVAIAESENPGAVTKVFAYDEQFNEALLFELTPRPIPLESRLLNLFFEDPGFKIFGLKVVIDGEVVPGYNGIDAIGISASNIPINVLINLAVGINSKMTTEKLSTNVNSDYVEHSPIISPDGKRLYFSRKYHPDNIGGVDDPEDIWMSEWNEETGEWKPAVNVGEPLNTEGPNFISSVTIVNGEEVLILGNRYGKKGRMYSGVSISRQTNHGFEKPAALEVENEYNYSPKTDFFLVSTGEALVMSVERDDSYGGRDLYVSFRQGATWSEPKNLGGDINTAGEDFAPFLGQDSRILYYSTTGMSGYGGADIFVAIRLDDSWMKWSVPENLGSGLNTKEDDQYFSIPYTGKHIYFSRGDLDEDTDIFRFKAEELFDPEVKDNPYATSIQHLTEEPEEVFITIEGKLLDSRGLPMPGAKVVVERLPDGLHVGEVETKEDGSYRFRVRSGARYGISAKMEGFISEDQNFDFNEVTEDQMITTNIKMAKIESGVEVVLNNIFFDFNEAILKTSSYSELNRVLEFLKDGQIKRIEISGHTDSVGDETYNMGLSERRAQAVYNFFRLNGIEKSRIVSAGYGESKPKVPNDTPENRQLNRRVEFKIVE